MDSIFDYFEKADPVWGAFLATTFTWLLTACGAAFVFFLKSINRNVMDGMLGFTGGVMVAASIWSLLIPAIDMSPGEGFMQIVPAVVGFLLGAIFLFCCDKILPHFHANFKIVEGVKSPWQKTTLLVLAITLHNIPEGLAVGVLFGGVAVGMPVRRVGLSRRKRFFAGRLSAVVGPIAGVVGALAVTCFAPILPYALAFAARARIFVVLEEGIPEAQQNKNSDSSTIGFIV